MIAKSSMLLFIYSYLLLLHAILLFAISVNQCKRLDSKKNHTISPEIFFFFMVFLFFFSCGSKSRPYNEDTLEEIFVERKSSTEKKYLWDSKRIKALQVHSTSTCQKKLNKSEWRHYNAMLNFRNTSKPVIEKIGIGIQNSILKLM